MVIVGHMHEERRQYIRHPSNIPITYSTLSHAEGTHEKHLLHNISIGGVCFETGEYLERGTAVMIRIALVHPVFEEKAIVAWCRKVNDHYDIGVQFQGQDTRFRARMVEQVCHIEQYKRNVFAEEGRNLSGEEAAREWITKYAAQFPAEY